MTPQHYIQAARVPHTVQPQEFGLWNIQRIRAAQAVSQYESSLSRQCVGFDDYTLLRRVTGSTVHIDGEVVMEDSRQELQKHLPIWMAARGRVLVTGLGLGCVVRGLLASDRVDHITVIEKCPYIVERIGAEFWSHPRVSLYLEDALHWNAGSERFDFAWHDLWTDQDAGEPHLQNIHAKLFIRYRKTARVQGAWAFPRTFWRLYARRLRLIGGPKFRGRIAP